MITLMCISSQGISVWNVGEARVEMKVDSKRALQVWKGRLNRASRSSLTPTILFKRLRRTKPLFHHNMLNTQRKSFCTIRGVGNISGWLMIGQLRWWLDRCVCGVAGAEGGRAAPPRCQPGAVAALAAFSGAAAIAGLRRGIQCGMGRSWGGHGLSRNTDCPPLSTHLPTSATRPIEPPVWSPFGLNPFREQSKGV